MHPPAHRGMGQEQTGAFLPPQDGLLPPHRLMAHTKKVVLLINTEFDLSVFLRTGGEHNGMSQAQDPAKWSPDDAIIWGQHG